MGTVNIQLFPDDGFALRPEGLLRSGEHAVLLSDRTLLFYDLTAGEQIGRADLPAEDAFVLLTAIDKYAYVMRIHGDAGELSVLCFDLGSAMQVREMTLPVFDYYCATSPIAVCGEDLFAHDLSDNSIWRLCLTSGELTEIPVVLPEEAASFNLTYEERGFLKPSPLALSPDGKLLFTAATDPSQSRRRCGHSASRHTA